MKKILRYIGIERIGLLEIVLAMYPILCGYQYGQIPLQLLALVVLDIIVLLRGQGNRFFKQPNKALLYLAIFVIVHETFLFFTLPNVPSYFVNYYYSFLILFPSILLIGPAVDLEKLIGSINLVAIICLLGLLYQFPIIISGGVTTPIALPFLPALAEGARVYDVLARPSSFFWEPQSYCSFMFVPLFFALLNRKMVWAIIITVSMFLSGSTTGIVISMFMFLYTTVFSSVKIGNKVFVAILTVGMIVLLFSSSLFEIGVTKMERTKFDENSRLINGIELVTHMPLGDLIFGGNSATVADYYFSGAAVGADLLEKNNTVFVSTIWMIIVKFGIVGFLFYIWAYIKPIIQRKEIAVYALALIIMLFSNPDYITGIFAFEMIVINCFLLNYQNNDQNESLHSYNTLRK